METITDVCLINFPIQRTSTRRYTCCTDILKYAYVKLFINTYMIDSKTRVLITTILRDKQNKQDVNYNCCCNKRSRDHNSHLSNNSYYSDLIQNILTVWNSRFYLKINKKSTFYPHSFMLMSIPFCGCNVCEKIFLYFFNPPPPLYLLFSRK